MVKGITTSKLKRGISRVLALLLLVLYTVGSSQLDMLHELVHDHDLAGVHAEGQAQDPFHCVIHYGDTEQRCGHASQLTVSDKCHMCDLAYHGDQTWVGSIAQPSAKFKHDFFSFYSVNLTSYAAVISSSRAPPTFISFS